jgi:xanthine/uracil permease
VFRWCHATVRRRYRSSRARNARCPRVPTSPEQAGEKEALVLALAVLVIAFVISSLTLGVLVENAVLFSMAASLLIAPLAGAYVRRCNQP